MEFFLSLLILSVVAFIQNMAFTAVSRSRNAGDPQYHRKCAWLSNGIWLTCYIFIFKNIWPILTEDLTFTWDSLGKLVVLVFVYVGSTTEGSVFMMKRLLRTEKGLRKVGANAEEESRKEESKVNSNL